jgi:teichuronic acid biosynthesis protein TuaE
MPSIEITPTGFRWNPNNLGVVLSICLPFSMNFKNKHLRNFISLIIVFVIIMTGSRLSVLAILISVFVFFLFTNLKYLIIYTTVTSISIIILLSTFDKSISNPYYHRFHESVSFFSTAKKLKVGDDKFSKDVVLYGEMESSLARKELMKKGWTAFVKTKGLGVGGGGSIAVMEKENMNITSMHNFWFEILVEGGALIFLSFVVWYCLLLYKLILIWNTTNNTVIKKFSFSLGISFMCFVVSAVSASSTIYFFPMWLLFGLVIAFVHVVEKESIGDITVQN